MKKSFNSELVTNRIQNERDSLSNIETFEEPHKPYNQLYPEN